MGFRSTTRRGLAVFSLIVPVLGTGYYAADPGTLRSSGEAEAHAVDMASSAHTRSLPPATGTAMQAIPGEAQRLFAAAVKGPRADRYHEEAQTTTRAKRPVHLASLTSHDGDITGSIPPEREPRPEITRATKGDRKRAALPEAADMAPRPLDTRPSAALFLASMPGAGSYSFQDQKEGGPDGPVELPRGLEYQGETEEEYQARQRRCLATAIYFEARGEPERGQLAVAQVVMNRVRSAIYPDTICGVVFQGQWQPKGCQFSFACDGKADVPENKALWTKAREYARQVTDGEVWLPEVGHATHYHANYVKPAWRRYMDHVKQIGQHIFYQVRFDQMQDALLGDDEQEQGVALN